MRKILSIVIALILLNLSLPRAFAQERICSIYFTKIGCPVCAKTDPVILGEWPKKHKDLVLIEYVFKGWNDDNAILLGEYALKFGISPAVPLLIFEKEHALGLPSVFDVENKLSSLDKKCRLLDKTVSFEELDFNELPVKPKIWANGRLLVRLKRGNVSNEFLREVLFAENLEEVLKNSNYRIVEIPAKPAPISYGQIEFKKAFKIEDSWILKCNENITGFPLEEFNEENITGNLASQTAPSNQNLILYASLGIGLVIICLLLLAFKVRVRIKWS
ncbi:MAG TPA: hypothetical protein ENF99_01620 [Candidatus Aenigmarchaeota archaeon]|nr:hypothetical protein [Candidatus Aenigmarchaeota archaeon]